MKVAAANDKLLNLFPLVETDDPVAAVPHIVLLHIQQPVPGRLPEIKQHLAMQNVRLMQQIAEISGSRYAN